MLEKLSDHDLLTQTETLILDERKVTTSILFNFLEIENRKLYAKRGYSSLFAMAVEYFKYSAGAAERRIAASRVLKVLPEIEEKIQSGVLSLTNVSKAQGFFESEKTSLQEKRSILESLEHKSTREAERILLKLSPHALPKEKVRALTDTHTEIRIIVDENLKNTLDALKARFSHKNPKMTYSELIEILAHEVSSTPAPVNKIKKEVVKRAQGMCEYVDDQTQKRCGSTYLLEVDHLYPQGLGGVTKLENLRLLCRTHNQLEARSYFGAKHMQKFEKRV